MEFQKELERNLEAKKGPASLHRPEIETVIDSFVIHESPEIRTSVSTRITPETRSSITRIIPETRSSVESMSSGLDVMSFLQ